MTTPDDEQPPVDPPRPKRKPRRNDPGPDPTPDEIAAGLALIRSEWSEETHRERAGEIEPREWLPPRGRFGVIH